jgi:hypothetical protein
MKSSISQIKHLVQGPTSRLDQVEDKLSGLEDKVTNENIQIIKKNEQKIMDL